MNLSKLAPYAKAVVALAGAVAVTAGCLVDGNLSVNDLTVIAAAWATVIGVHQIPNRVG